MKNMDDINAIKDLAKRKIDKVISDWFSSDPMMLSAWCLADKKADPKQETIGIDSKINPPVVRYNPKFINALSQEQLECVLASEGFKILLRHPTSRLMQPKEISSLASQITIDQSIMGNLLNINDIFPMPGKFNLEPNRCYEEYFRKLMDALDKVSKQISQMFGEGEQGQENQNGQGQGQGEKESDKPDNKNSFKDFKDGKDALKNYFDPRGSSNKDWEQNDLMDADVNNLINERKHSTKDWGKFTGDAMGIIVAANTPKISYKEVLRRFNISVLSSSSITSRMKVNRRYDLQCPGYRRQYHSKIIFAIDESGSMSDDDIAEGFAVVNSVCKHSTIEYLLFDTEIKQIEKKMHKAKKSFKVVGRGGTDFDCVIEYADKNHADGIIIYTDGCAPAPKKPKSMKVLWLMSKKNQTPPVKWGFVATLDRYESH